MWYKHEQNIKTFVFSSDFKIKSKIHLFQCILNYIHIDVDGNILFTDFISKSTTVSCIIVSFSNKTLEYGDELNLMNVFSIRLSVRHSPPSRYLFNTLLWGK